MQEPEDTQSNEGPNEGPKIVEASGGARNIALQYWEEAKLIMFKPKVFFGSMPVEGGLAEPFKFLAVVSGVNALLSGLLGFNMITIALLLPASIVGCLLASVVATFLSNTMGGKGTFEGTFRAMAYSEAPLIFAWIPVIGVAAVLYTWVLNFFGLRRVHELSEVKTIAVVILSGIIAAFVLGLAACGIFLKSILKF